MLYQHNLRLVHRAGFSFIPKHVKVNNPPRAANYTSSNTPHGISEWGISGLTASPSTLITPTFVAESAFSAECKLYSQQEILSSKTGMRSAMLVLVEVVQWHVRADAIDERRESVNIEKLRPMWRAGGITYGNAMSGFELPRPERWGLVSQREGVEKFVKEKVEGQ
jgi:flavin reductase (DIM6/NTAB) family NADH-FMN oxidoreductase RutF